MKFRAESKPLERPLQGGTANATVAVEPLPSGEMQAPAAFLERSGGRLEALRMLGLGAPRSQWWWLPCPAFLIRHPSAGHVLVDTGLHPSVSTTPSENLGRLVSSFAHPRWTSSPDGLLTTTTAPSTKRMSISLIDASMPLLATCLW